MFKLVGSLSRVAVDNAPIYFARCSMASGRNVYIRGGSNKQDIPAETKKLIETARDPDDMRWQLGHGIQQPLEVDLTTEEKTRATQYKVKYKGNRLMDGEDKVKYYPHAGEQLPDGPPSPVLMVEKAKTEYGEPYWIKDYLIQIGLDADKKVGHKVFLPNTPSVGMILYRIKHIVRITPVTFPNGIPDNFDPDTHGYSLSAKGEFTITDVPRESPESIAARAEWMKIDTPQIFFYQRQQWRKPWGSPLGNHNYYQDTRWSDPAKAASAFEKNKPKNKKWS